jgi:hypothetical protein
MILNDFVIEPTDVKIVSNFMLSDETNKLASDEVIKFSLLQELIKKTKQKQIGNNKKNIRFM